MTTILSPVSVSDCIASGSHRTNCDRYGACNHCGSRDPNDDAPVQRTFGEIVGKLPTLPIAPHPEDLHLCEDTGEWKRHNECLFSYDGKAWWFHDDRYDYESSALVELSETLLEGMDDYVDHVDSINEAIYHAFNDDLTWREYIGDYYNDDCDDCNGHTKHELEMICDDLRDHADSVVKCRGYSNFDYDLTSFDVGEVHDQIMLNDHPLLKDLHSRDELESMLDDYSCDHDFICNGKFVSEGCLDLMLASDKTYWWGCSHETMEEVYHSHVNSAN